MRMAKKVRFETTMTFGVCSGVCFFNTRKPFFLFERRLLEMSRKYKNGRNPLFYQESQPFIRFLKKQGKRGSNPHLRFWRPLLYHWTIPLRISRLIILAQEAQIVNDFFNCLTLFQHCACSFHSHKIFIQHPRCPVSSSFLQLSLMAPLLSCFSSFLPSRHTDSKRKRIQTAPDPLFLKIKLT